jgi:hypothetical protein
MYIRQLCASASFRPLPAKYRGQQSPPGIAEPLQLNSVMYHCSEAPKPQSTIPTIKIGALVRVRLSVTIYQHGCRKLCQAEYSEKKKEPKKQLTSRLIYSDKEAAISVISMAPVLNAHLGL